MLSEHTLDQLRALRLDGMVRAIEDQATSTAAHELPFDDRLTMLVQSEIAWRDDRRVARLLKAAKLKVSAACIEDINWRASRGLDRGLITALAVVGLSAPSFAVGLLLLYVFAVKLGWFPVYGLGDGGFAEALPHLLLPAITLAVGLFAAVIQVSRASLLEQVESDYTLFAQSRGVPRGTITRWQLRNAALPIRSTPSRLLTSISAFTVRPGSRVPSLLSTVTTTG